MATPVAAARVERYPDGPRHSSGPGEGLGSRSNGCVCCERVAASAASNASTCVVLDSHTDVQQSCAGAAMTWRAVVFGLAPARGGYGLIRQYLSKGQSTRQLRQRDCDAIAHRLNHRPRKRLGYRTSEECSARRTTVLHYKLDIRPQYSGCIPSVWQPQNRVAISDRRTARS